MGRARAVLRGRRRERRRSVRHLEGGKQTGAEGAGVGGAVMNLPNSITAGRILTAPFIAALPFIASPGARLIAFVLYIAAAVTDYYDGKLARTRGLVTDMGRQLDPLADKLLLVGTLVPMYILAGSGAAASLLSPHQTPLHPDVVGPMLRDGTTQAA